MKERQFKFRAQVALDVRQRLDDEAQRARAAAEAAVQQAGRALEEARARLQDACAQPAGAAAAGIDPDWYRNWMIRLRAAITRCSEDLAKRSRERDAALARALDARRGLRAIERLRDRRRRAFDLETRRREQTEIDALAVQQYVAPSRAPGGFS
jgi:flagellar export protein FliJ